MVQNTKRPRSEPAPTLRDRAASLKAGLMNAIGAVPAVHGDQPQPASLPEGRPVETVAPAFREAAGPSHDAFRGHPDDLNRERAEGGLEPRPETTMGRHENFKDAAPIAEDLLASTSLHHRTNDRTAVAMNSDRVALLNYASWLFMERRLACIELYPHAKGSADEFVPCISAVDRFHFPDDRSWGDVPQPSARAAAVLDLAGVDWRSEIPDQDSFDPENFRPNPGTPVPLVDPALDAELLIALSDLRRLDAAVSALLSNADPECDASDVPGYDTLDDARDVVLAVLSSKRARGLPGLQAKARAILDTSVRDFAEPFSTIARSLASDFAPSRPASIEPKSDPILAAIDECRRLIGLAEAAEVLPRGNQKRAQSTLVKHNDGVLLQTVPITAAGCVALAAFAGEFFERRGRNLEDVDGAVLSLIARSPLL